MRIERSLEVASPHYLLPPEPFVEVGQGEWKSGQAEFLTSGVDSCVVLAALNEKSSKGMLGHFSCVAPHSSAIPELENEQSDTLLFNAAVKNIIHLGDPCYTSIWLGGCAMRPESSIRVQQSIRMDRAYAEQKIEELRRQIGLQPEATTAEWNLSPYDIQVTLNCHLGLLFVQLESID